MERVYIYEKNKSALKFLKGFFKGHEEYSVKFFNDAKTLERRLTDDFYALIVGAPQCLDELANIEPFGMECYTIAMVSSDVTKGMRSIIRHNIESYMLSPFFNDDLKYKLRAICKMRNIVENVYRDKKDLQAIAELTYLVSSTLDPKEVLYFIVKKLSEVINVTRCSILSIGFGEQRYAHVVSSFEDPKIKDIRLDLRKYPEIQKAFTTKKTVIVKDAMTDLLMKPVKRLISPIGIKSIVVIPVMFRDEVIGTLFLRTSRAGHVFTDREIQLCNAIANASANALYNAFLYERVSTEKAKLENLAITDFLTGIYNIRYFYHRLEGEFSRSQRYGTDLSCIMLDIDYFKEINDTYGHRVGDMVLREFAQLVKNHTRKSDVFARYGGEEFILLLPQTNTEGALREGRRLSRVIKGHIFKDIKKRSITASMGIASCPDKNIKIYDDLISLADDALFQAKNTGRDKVVVYR